MNFLSILKDIFLEDGTEGSFLSSPKNLTGHYHVELRHVDFDEVCTGGEYSILERQIERYKYQSDRHISTELVDILARCVEVSEQYPLQKGWVVVPVPMHWSRYILRGFHHTSLLASGLASHLGIQHKNLLATQYRRRQSNLSRKERMENKKDSFFLKNRYTVPSHIILVDDVVSSGSTLHEAARVLKRAGAEKVICFTIASNQ